MQKAAAAYVPLGDTHPASLPKNKDSCAEMTGQPEEPPLQQVITDLFHDFEKDETGGQDASRGFNFQVWHAVFEALKAYKTGNDFAIVLEWQQDIAVLNSSTNPTAVRFLQLKKNERAVHWTLNQLSTPDKSGDSQLESDESVGVEPETEFLNNRKKTAKTKKIKPSFLAKLYFHRRRFKSLASSRLEFVSNARYQITDESGKAQIHDAIELVSLNRELRKDLENKIRTQLAIPEEELIDICDIGLLLSDCPMTDAHKHLTGELAEMQIASDLQLSAAATMIAVLLMASYMHQRAGSKRFAKNFEELLQRAVTRNDVSNYLIAANNSRVSTEDKVLEVIARLNAELAPFTVVSKMKQELSRVCIEITNRAGPVPMVAARLNQIYHIKQGYDQFDKLSDQFRAWYDDFNALPLNNEHMYKREYLYCLMAMIVQNATPIQLLPSVPTGSQPKDEK